MAAPLARLAAGGNTAANVGGQAADPREKSLAALVHLNIEIGGGAGALFPKTLKLSYDHSCVKQHLKFAESFQETLSHLFLPGMDPVLWSSV